MTVDPLTYWAPVQLHQWYLHPCVSYYITVLRFLMLRQVLRNGHHITSRLVILRVLINEELLALVQYLPFGIIYSSSVSKGFVTLYFPSKYIDLPINPYLLACSCK